MRGHHEGERTETVIVIVFIVTDRAGEEGWTAQAVAQTADLTPYAVVDSHLPPMRCGKMSTARRILKDNTERKVRL